MMPDFQVEGVFSTLGLILTAYGGYAMCLLMKACNNDKALLVKSWLSYSIFFIVASLPMLMFMPYIKALWTPSFALVTIGISGLALTLIMILVDIVLKAP